MQSIQAIVELADSARQGEGSPLAMATVVKIRGSAYRRPGARMLMDATGRSAGMISGGCLENDVRQWGKEVVATGVPRIVTYDSTAPEDIVFGLGLGCNGIVQILIEPLSEADGAGLLGFLSACVARRQVGRIATVIESDDFPLGARLLRWPDASVSSTIDSPELSAAIMLAFQETAARRSALREIDLPDGRSASVLLESIAPPVPLTIFGAADDAVPVAQLAKLLGWQVTVIDHRSAYATSDRFPTADAVHCLRPEELAESPDVVLPPESLVVLMTHHFSHDVELLRVLLPRGAAYIGVLGPKSRTERLLDALEADGVTIGTRAHARLHGPTGLDIGAETPEEIAVSIIAEMQAVLAQRSGGALRDRLGPIHEPADQAITAL